MHSNMQVFSQAQNVFIIFDTSPSKKKKQLSYRSVAFHVFNKVGGGSEPVY